jgi:ALG6, ALG8 glycosyltransferase family
LVLSAAAVANASTLSSLPPLLRSLVAFGQNWLPLPRQATSSTLGLDRAGVGMRLLPDVGAGLAAAAVVMLFVPFALHSVASSRRDGGRLMVSQTMQLMAAAALCSFMAGYHVHEKSILISVMLLLPVAIALPPWRSFYAAFRCSFKFHVPQIISLS